MNLKSVGNVRLNQQVRKVTQSKLEPGAYWPLAIVLISWALTYAASFASYQALSPSTHEPSPREFSVANAEQYLKTLVGDGIPHPAGSEQNDVVRDRVILALESMGYEVTVQSGSVGISSYLQQRSGRSTVDLDNLLAVRKGTHPGKAIALVTHFDSHPAGPGASDDGVGTAALLEIARIFSTETPRRDIAFLITDGEEFGLLGAKLFTQHPFMKQIGLVINLEARGTTGPSLMFETSPHSRQLISHFANSAPSPISSSLFREIYKRLPNDTDFTVFNEAGKLGFNFAFIGDVQNYHTPADNFENYNPSSLNHHGQNALRLIRQLQDAPDLDELINTERNDWSGASAQDDAVYFDLFGLSIIWWPAFYSLWLSIVAAIGIAVYVRGVGLVEFAGNKITSDTTASKYSVQPCGAGQNILIGLAVQLLMICCVVGFGLLMNYFVQLDPRLSNPWPSQPVPMSVGFWSACAAVMVAIVIATKRGVTPQGLWVGLCIVWTALACLTSVSLSGGSYLFIVPLLVTALIAVAALLFRIQGAWVIVASAIAVGIVWLPLDRLFYDAVGFRMAPLLFGRIALSLTSLIPVIRLLKSGHQFWLAMILIGVSVGAFLMALLFG